MEIITENRTTNPPINKIVLIEFVILFPIIPPKLDKEMLLVDAFDEEFAVTDCLIFDFQNLKIIPTVIEANKWLISNKIPIVELPNIEIPTVPKINSGPELFVKLKRRSHSSFEQILFNRKFAAILAPVG